jgi:hypothetical protein
MSNEELRIRLETLQVSQSVCVCVDSAANGVGGSDDGSVPLTRSSRVQDGFVQLRSILRREKQSRADSDRHPMEDM